MKYDSVSFMEDRATAGTKTNDGFIIETLKSASYHAKKLIFATGITDLVPDVKGFKACWGISIIHCPYCHGYEFRNQETGIMANGERAFHIATLVKNLTGDVTIFTTGPAEFSPEQLQKLERQKIRIIEEPIVEAIHKNGKLQHITLNNGERLPFAALYAAFPFSQHSLIPESLGCEMTEQGHIKIDGFQQTSVSGIYACGDNSAMMRSVANAVYAGNLAGAAVNKEISMLQF